MNEKTTFYISHLSEVQESAIKNSIPWDSIDRKARELVKFANQTTGIATLQSCAGHIELNEDGSFGVTAAHLALKATQKRTNQILFNLAPRVGIHDVSIRYFEDGTFWICLNVDPGERGKLYDLFRRLQEIEK